MSWWLVAGLVLGIICGELFNHWLLAGLSLGFGLVLLVFSRRQAVALCVIFFAAGMLLTVFHLQGLYRPEYGREEVLLIKSTKLVQEGDSYAWQGKVLEPESLAGATVLIYSDSYSSGVYRLRGVLYPPVQYRNPGQGWHYKRKIYNGEIGCLNRPETLSYQPVSLNLLQRARENYRQNILDNIACPDSAALALALTTGDRSMLAGELKSALYLTGTGHIMAISGLHVGILLGLILGLLRFLRLSRAVAAIIALVCIAVYIVFAGPSPSLVRAALMAAWGVAALLAGREKQGFTALQWTVFAMLLYNPLQLFDYAFVFSLISTFVCLRAKGSLDKLLVFLPTLIRQTAAVTILIQLVALPLVIGLFGSSSLWSLFANIVIVPLMPFLAGFSLLAGLLPGAMGAVVAFPARILLKGVAAFLTLLTEFPLPIRMGGLGLALTAVASLGLLLHLSGLGFKKTAYLLVTGMSIVVLVFNFFTHCVTTVWFLDVGQGDAIVIRSRGQWTLVDCGDARAGEKAVLPALRYLGADRLKRVIISHPHADHLGGLAAVLAEVPADQVVVNFSLDLPQATEVSAPVTVLDGLEICSHQLELANVNDTSLLVSLGGDKVLLTGDIEADGEMLYSPRLRPHQVLKVAHHGSKSSTSPAFLEQVRPGIAVVSCGLANSFGFPDESTLDNLARVNCRVYRTDVCGCVRAVFWPWGGVSVKTFAGR